MKHILLILCLFSLPFASSAQNTPQPQASEVDYLFAGRFTNQTPGVAVAVISDNKVVFSKGYGAANLEYGIPNQPNTIFDLASLSKQFTSFAIATLIRSGKISLDDDIRKYIPELHDFGHVITVKNLLMHTGGLRDQNDLLNLLGYRDGDVITNSHILGLLFKQKELNFVPGQQFLYSNSGFTLLAQIVERVTKVPFNEWMQQHVFSPLKMKNTFFITDNGAVIKNKAYSYAQWENGYRKMLFNSTNNGARGLQSTAEDLCLWVKNFSEHTVGNDGVMNLMNTVPENNYRVKYNFGQAFSTYKGRQLIEHDGSDAGYRTYIGRFPDQKLAVIMLGNLESIVARNTGLEIADIFLGESAPMDEEPAKEKIILPDDVEERLEGQYQVAPGRLLTIWADDHVIRTTVNQEKKDYILDRLSTTLLESKDLDATFSPKKGRMGEPDSLVYKSGKTITVAPKIFVEDPEREKLKEFEGEYYSDELSVSYNISLKNNNLVVELPRRVFIRLRKLEPALFSGSYYWFKRLKFTRNEKSEVAGFEVSSGRSYNMKFRRTK